MNDNLLAGTNRILSYAKKQPTALYGLKWQPTVEPEASNNLDWIGVECNASPPRHFSELDHMALTTAYNMLDETPKLIVEIGVDRSESYEVSSTSTLLKLKPKDCMYIGIDIADKSSLNSIENNVYTIRGNSANHEELYKLMDWYSIPKIDMMFVDGDHSVNQVLLEWKYWERMISRGVMAYHDTNYHPGPVSLLDAVDTNIFSVDYFGRGEHDWGVGIVKRL